MTGMRGNVNDLIEGNEEVGQRVFKNVSVGELYEYGLKYDEELTVADNGALVAYSRRCTGRSPKDKRIVKDSKTEHIWWGEVNIELEGDSFEKLREMSYNYLKQVKNLFVVDGYAGWDRKYRKKIRVVCTKAYHALFMQNMLVRLDEEDKKEKFEPDWVILNAGELDAPMFTVKGVSSKQSVSFDFGKQEIVILGTLYAGEMKKGVFTIMNYVMPNEGCLSMHASVNVSKYDNSSTVFFGLSGTGKTTLSADPDRLLIGDDEHIWSETGLSNIEGGCYAKCINLSQQSEPDIYNAIKFGSIIENAKFYANSKIINYNDASITQNTRVSYPIQHISNSLIPCFANHPSNIIFLTCDAFGLLPPISRLTIPQAMYQFISGYTSKIPGTETGISQPTPVFSTCFGAPFMIHNPTTYATILQKLLLKHKTQVWLVNTGWVGGSYKDVKRISIKLTRQIISAINNNSFSINQIPFQTYPIFNFQIPTSVPGFSDSTSLNPSTIWQDKSAFKSALIDLAKSFHSNFAKLNITNPSELLQGQPTIN